MMISPTVRSALETKTRAEIASIAARAERARIAYNPRAELTRALARLEAGIALAEADHVSPTETPSAYTVHSADFARSYQVQEIAPCASRHCRAAWHCTCPDHSERGARCKHLLAVAAVIREERLLAARAAAEARLPRKVEAEAPAKFARGIAQAKAFSKGA